MTLRPATLADAKLLFDWANDPVVRHNAFNQEPIEWEGHLQWLQKKLTNPQAALWIAEVEGVPVGQFRVDLLEEGDVVIEGAPHIAAGHLFGEIGFSVAQEWRGKRLGPTILEEGARAAFARFPVMKVLRGTVKATNPASSRSFLAAGYLVGPESEKFSSRNITFQIEG